MRRRKPWVLARRRLFGWKVRLLTMVSKYFGTSADVRPGLGARARLLQVPTSSTRPTSGHASRSHLKAGQRYVARAQGSNREARGPTAGGPPLSRAVGATTSIVPRRVPQQPGPHPVDRAGRACGRRRTRGPVAPRRARDPA
jgi:hypothetical protein